MRFGGRGRGKTGDNKPKAKAKATSSADKAVAMPCLQLMQGKCQRGDDCGNARSRQLRGSLAAIEESLPPNDAAPATEVGGGGRRRRGKKQE